MQIEEYQTKRQDRKTPVVHQTQQENPYQHRSQMIWERLKQHRNSQFNPISKIVCKQAKLDTVTSKRSQISYRLTM